MKIWILRKNIGLVILFSWQSTKNFFHHVYIHHTSKLLPQLKNVNGGSMAQNKEFIFRWDNIEKNDNKKNLLDFLKKDFKVNWAENATIEKTGDGKILRIQKGDGLAEIILDKNAILKINDEAYNLYAIEEDGNINIYKNINGIGHGQIGRIGILSIALYNVLFFLVLLAGILMILPTIAIGYSSKEVSIFGFVLTMEARLVLVVALSGALGGLVHSLKSFYWYLGNRGLVWSWAGMYILMPFLGSALGLIFYLVIRGGFFSPQATVDQTSPFGFAALSVLVGLFSEQAVLKLKKVAETVLTEASEGKNSTPQEIQKKE